MADVLQILRIFAPAAVEIGATEERPLLTAPLDQSSGPAARTGSLAVTAERIVAGMPLPGGIRHE